MVGSPTPFTCCFTTSQPDLCTRDTVSSVGVSGKHMPETTETHSLACFFRHALASDERRVKFLPVYACGGAHHHDPPKGVADFTIAHRESGARDHPSLQPWVKEVWFAGCHSDVCVFIVCVLWSGVLTTCNDRGGDRVISPASKVTSSNWKKHKAQTISDIPCLWLVYEGEAAGLRIRDEQNVPIKLDEIKAIKPNDSLSGIWRFAEFVPFWRLSFNNANHMTP